MRLLITVYLNFVPDRNLTNFLSKMYTNDITDLSTEVSECLNKGGKQFHLDFSQHILGEDKIVRIIEPFKDIDLPNELEFKINLSSGYMDDDSVPVLVEQLKQVKWPEDVDFTLLIKSNMFSEKGGQVLIDLADFINKLPSSKVSMDLENNNAMNCSVIAYALKKIEGSKIKDNTVFTKDERCVIEFSSYIIEEHFATDIESDSE